MKIKWTPDGRVNRLGWPRPQATGDMTDLAGELADALDECVWALRLIADAADVSGYVVDTATNPLRKLGVEP